MSKDINPSVDSLRHLRKLRVMHPNHHDQKGTQKQPFQCRFIKLRGVAGAGALDAGAILRGAAWKDHAPGQIGWAAPKLGIDEVGDPTEEQANGCRHGHGIGQTGRGPLSSSIV